jgi:hypothetical protein
VHEQRFTTMGRFSLTLNLLIPILIVVTLIIANVLLWDAGGTARPPLWWSAFIGAFGAFFGVRSALLAHTVIIRSDGRVELHRILGVIVLRAEEIQAIGPSLLRPFLSAETRQGVVLLPNQWNGLHEFVEYVRRNNPGLRLKGM